MRELLKRAKPDRLEDLIALNALYRPGPMDLIPDFIERKHGRQRVEYLHPSIEPILAETYGVMVYQEQVMRIAQVVGGYSLGGADLLRRAMGKKKPEEMATHRTIFVEGAGGKGVSAEVATELFDHMEKFAGYGFNKSHSAAYAVVAYQTAYFKAHYPAAFMAANLSTVMDDTDKVKDLIEDCKALGLKILSPDINAGGWRFEPVDVKTIRYGLGGNQGHRAGRDRSDSRSARRRRTVHRSVRPVRPGRQACDQPPRGRGTCARGRARPPARRSRDAAGDRRPRDRSRAARGRVGGPGEPVRRAATAPSAISSTSSRRAGARATSCRTRRWHSATTSPGTCSREYAGEARQLAPTSLAAVRQARDLVKLAGVIVPARSQNTRRGRMGVVVLDDGTAQLELMVFSELYDRKRALLKEDQLLFVVGKVRYDEFAQRLSISADDLMDLTEARARAAARLNIEVEGAGDAARLRDALSAYRVQANGTGNGGCRIIVSYSNASGTVDVALPEDWRVRPDDRLIADLCGQTRVRRAQFTYAQ